MKVRKKGVWMLAMLAAALALPLSAAAARDSAGRLDDGRACSLTVNVTGADTDSVEELELAGLSGEDIIVDLYKVADIEPEQERDDYKYGSFGVFESEGTEALRSSANELLQLRLEQKDAGERWDALAQELVRTVVNSENLACTASGAADTPIALEGPGLYLVIVRGAEPGLAQKADYFKTEAVKDGAEGETHIVTRVRTAGYEYTFMPALVSLPEHREDPDGGYVWEYEVAMNPKHGTGYRLGSLRIEKELRSFVEKDGGNTAAPATFVFRIDSSYADEEGRIGGVFEYHDVVSMSFTGCGKQEILLENLFPVGAQVTVEEIYSGAAYEIEGEKKFTVTAADNEGAGVTVRFVNEYNHSGNGGGAVENAFELIVDGNGRPVTDEGGRPQWTWIQRKAAQAGEAEE